MQQYFGFSCNTAICSLSCSFLKEFWSHYVLLIAESGWDGFVMNCGVSKEWSQHLYIVCIHNTHGFFSLLSLSLFLSFLRCCWHMLGVLTSQASLSQNWIFAVASFRLCVILFLFTCFSLSSFIVVHALLSPTCTVFDGIQNLNQPTTWV